MARLERGGSEESALAPISGGILDFALVAAAVVTVAFVALWFQLDVNRVFDVPKALVLKVGGCGILLVWMINGLFGRGFPWRSIQIFAAPVFTLALAITVSTFFSIDVGMSFYGVYERQFGLQGFLGCIGLFAVTATCLRSRRGAIAALSALALIGGVVGTYSLLQANGVDPYGFFRQPHNKVYSTLGNATFAGNALALIFPMSVLLASIASATTLAKGRFEGLGARSRSIALAGFALGCLGLIGLQTVPGYLASSSTALGLETKQAVFKLGVSVSLAMMIALALSGSFGPAWGRFQSAAHQRIADAMAAGGLAGAVVSIGIGLVTTRTRGAWVGTGVAIVAGFLLLPRLFRDDPTLYRRVRLGAWGTLGALVAAAVLFIVLRPNHLYSVTVKSIPAAFDPERTVYGQGQGTRPYLWSESPRVLLNHKATLERKHRDRDELVSMARSDLLSDLDLPEPRAETAGEKSFESAWRSVLVWPFGIGIETYRYAFMSHKSKKLEALDPMTNHDNPHNNYLYVLASFGIFGIAAYVWLLTRILGTALGRFAGAELRDGKALFWLVLLVSTGALAAVLFLIFGPDPKEQKESRQTRAIALGVVTSFVSYAFYSIAGFDSVACSVFFYFLLGAAAVYFEPSGMEEPRRSLLVNVKRQWAAFRGREPGSVAHERPLLASVVVAGGCGLLLAGSMWGGIRVHSAERAYVGEERRRDILQKIEDIERAIRINPIESFYKQNLGSTYSDAARQLRAQASKLEMQGDSTDAHELLLTADRYSRRAEAALHAALDHAWAPENIFISAFQLYYSWNKLDLAERALERALEHSPHLGAVRANLAILKLERGAYREAARDCEWVLEVDPLSPTALKTCGRAYFHLGDLGVSEKYLERALSAAPRDPAIKSYMADLQRAKQAATSSAHSSG